MCSLNWSASEERYLNVHSFLILIDFFITKERINFDGTTIGDFIIKHKWNFIDRTQLDSIKNKSFVNF